MISKISYIYSLSSSENPELIRYIGFSNNPIKRLRDHLWESKKGTTRKCRWIQSELKKGNNIIIEPLSCFPENQIFKKETEFILLYKSLGANLINHNNGGIGFIDPDKETIEKKRISARGIRRVLPEDMVLLIYELYNEGLSVKGVCNLLGINKGHIDNIFYKPECYTDLKEKYNLKLRPRQKPKKI